MRAAWDAIAKAHFPTKNALLVGEKTFVECGAFSSVYKAMVGERPRDDVTLELLLSGGSVYGCRELVKTWLNALNVERQKPERRLGVELISALDTDQETYEVVERTDTDYQTDWQKYQRVKREQEAIVERLRARDGRNAERFTERLVGRQLHEGDAEFAAKTLCLLSQEAKRLGESSFQLKWAMRATQVYGDDPWSFAQTGDALVALYRYDDAGEYFTLAGTKGDPHYAKMGQARILKLSGHSEKALSAFDEIATQYPDHPNSFQAWIGAADTLRQNGELDHALDRYEQTIRRYPKLEDAYAGKAAVLRELGRLEEATTIYDQFRDVGGGTMWAFAGAAEVLREAGDFNQALGVYREATKQFPNAELIALGRAQVLRAAGRLDDALGEFQRAIEESHDGPGMHGGLAQTLRDIGRLGEALKVYEDAIERFPSEASLANGRASVIKRMGRLEEALAMYDESCQKFPYNLPALLGRIQLLKEFERLDLAFEAVKDLMAVIRTIFVLGPQWQRY